MAALPDAPEVDPASDGPALTPVAALFVLSRLCHSLTYRPLLTKLIAALLGVSEGVKRRRCILDVVGVCSQKDLAASALCLLAVLASNQFADDAALGASRFWVAAFFLLLVTLVCAQMLRGCCRFVGERRRGCSTC